MNSIICLTRLRHILNLTQPGATHLFDMLYPLLALGLGAAVTEAAVARASGCQLHFTASGAISGPVGEIASGQVRAGGGVSSTTFTLQGEQLWDDKGYGCWWTRKSFYPLPR